MSQPLPRLAASVAATALCIVFSITACQRSKTDESATADAIADSLAVRKLVLDFGQTLKHVPLTAPESDRSQAIRDQYGPYVLPSLIEIWVRDQRAAPGRLTSSPWPERIELRWLTRTSHDGFLADGDIVERTSADPPGGGAGRIPVRLVIRKMDEKWRIVEYEQGRPYAASDTAAVGETDPSLFKERAADVVRAYYQAINERRYTDAYLLWGQQGLASGKSFDDFKNGFAATTSVEAEVGPPGSIGAAAGSRYVEVPVQLTAVENGDRHSYAGAYTLRRSVVDGASSEQRSWRIYSARMRRVTQGAS